MKQAFEPRGYQSLAFQHMLDIERCNLWCFMGAGKTVSTLTLLDYLYRFGFEHRPTLILGPLRVARSVWPAEAKKWDHLDLEVSPIIGTEAERLRALKRDAQIYTINYENLPWMMTVTRGKWPFANIVADECFTGDTPIRTPIGERKIAELRAGDVVLTHLGAKRIAKVFTKEAYSFNLVRLTLSNGQRLDVTQDHPIFTDSGWLPARACAGRRLLSVDYLSSLSDRFYTSGIGSPLQSVEGENSVLFDVLSNEGFIPPAPRASSAKRAAHEALMADDDDFLEQRCSMAGGAPRAYFGGRETAEAEAKSTRWQWPRDDTLRAADCSYAPEAFYLELRHTVGEIDAWLSFALQSRFWRSNHADRLGSGRELPPYNTWSGSRRQKRGEVSVVRVDRRSNKERGSTAIVFNLEVEDAHTYFAGGVLVHNCTRLKGHRLNSGGLRAAALGKVAHSSSRWINLTGTPSPNGLIDLWGQQWFIDAGARLGKTFTSFRDRWFYPHPSGYGFKAHEFAQEQIHARLSDCTLTIKAEDWFDVAEPIVTDVYVDLPDKARKLYRQMEREMYIELEGQGIEAFNAASATMKCLQLANGAVYDQDGEKWSEVHTAKLDALEEILEEAAGEPVIVAYQFQHDLARILKRFKQARQLLSVRDETDWNEGRIPLLVLHPESAGHGLNLQDGGSRIVFFGHWWSLEPYQQVIERIGPVRQLQSGHPRSVYVYHILAKDTLDREVMLRRQTKASVQDLLLNAMRKAA